MSKSVNLTKKTHLRDRFPNFKDIFRIIRNFFFLVFRIIDKKLYNVNLELQPSTTNKLWLKMKQLQDFYIMKNEKKAKKKVNEHTNSGPKGGKCPY